MRFSKEDLSKYPLEKLYGAYQLDPEFEDPYILMHSVTRLNYDCIATLMDYFSEDPNSPSLLWRSFQRGQLRYSTTDIGQSEIEYEFGGMKFKTTTDNDAREVLEIKITNGDLVKMWTKS